jgi:hypothetical protein
MSPDEEQFPETSNERHTQAPMETSDTMESTRWHVALRGSLDDSTVGSLYRSRISVVNDDMFPGGDVRRHEVLVEADSAIAATRFVRAALPVGSLVVVSDDTDLPARVDQQRALDEDT